jgi:ABC-type transporter Mla MlaB component
MSFNPCSDREGIGIEIAEMTELVRGQEERLLERLMPLAGSQSVTLALGSVERIDAAGIAALIKLYCVASEAGHSFTVSHAAAHVEEILRLVGMERILASPSAEDDPCASLRLELSAA